ncbi:uncharacterized protein [Drosophila bipectinata]|uniref:uncharacterized protein n=1 Tax=Drosophila bipectinata TaxID=42026 RepID=UPI0007E79AA7|nr:uncharacterized protein LOC108124708 [Drosophila bipectinata]KAH8246030.1 hypothetical protein KR026_008102 [Drosophila bipectinata]
MLLDAIFFLPTLFTYLLILLLICILCFIVIYISHKIYISIYDNLPLPGHSRQALVRASNHVMTMRSFFEGSRIARSNQGSLRSLWIQNRSQILDTSTVLRIVVTLEPCYLVSIEFDVSPSRRAMSFLCTCDRDDTACCAVEPRPSNSVHIIRYFDHLSKVPRLKVMLKCNQRRTEQRRDSQARMTLDEVIQEAKEAQCTDPGAACRPPNARRSSRATAPD